MNCQRCGQCCKTVVLGIQIPIGDEKEVIKFLKYHLCETSPEVKDFWAIRIHSPCSELEFKDGIGICKIYDERPIFCKEYLCKKVRNALEV
jgi:Fe-S-cluster containining protein